MSFDLRVWCAQKVDIAPAFADEPNWSGTAGLWTYESETAFINAEIQKVDEDELEEMDPALLAAYPGFNWLVDINYSALEKNPSDLDMLVRIAQKLAKVTGGIVEDPQAETFTLLGQDSDGAKIQGTHNAFLSFGAFVEEARREVGSAAAEIAAARIAATELNVRIG